MLSERTPSSFSTSDPLLPVRTTLNMPVGLPFVGEDFRGSFYIWGIYPPSYDDRGEVRSFLFSPPAELWRQSSPKYVLTVIFFSPVFRRWDRALTAFLLSHPIFRYAERSRSSFPPNTLFTSSLFALALVLSSDHPNTRWSSSDSVQLSRAIRRSA